MVGHYSLLLHTFDAEAGGQDGGEPVNVDAPIPDNQDAEPNA
jgi:hypothetical protein